jgi:hypothetical protein
MKQKLAALLSALLLMAALAACGTKNDYASNGNAYASYGNAYASWGDAYASWGDAYASAGNARP